MTPEELREHEAMTTAREKMERAIKEAEKAYEKELKKYRETAANNHSLSTFVQPDAQPVAAIPALKPEKKSKVRRCEDQNDAGGCMIRESCGKKTAEDRATVGCTVPVKEKPAKKARKAKKEPVELVEPTSPPEQPRPVELHAACLDCDDLNTCESHDPHAGCAGEAKKSAEEPAATLKDPICYCTPCKTWATCTAKPESEECKAHRKLQEEPEEKKGGCTNCGHFKGRKSFKESCTRLKDLMFKGGEYSAARLMAEVEDGGCLGWTEQPEKPAKKTEPVHQCSACKKMCNNAFIPGKLCDPTKKKSVIKIGKDLQYCETLCANCGNHLGKFLETCPRYGDLKTQGGKHTERGLMEEVQRDGCTHKIPKIIRENSPKVCAHDGACGDEARIKKQQETAEVTGFPTENLCCGDCPEEKKKKKPRTKKHHYTICISPVTADQPQLVEMGRKYNLWCTGPECGNSGSEETREHVIKSALHAFNNWQESPNKNKGEPITEKDVLFEDTTGEFNMSDFFDADGKLKQKLEES